VPKLVAGSSNDRAVAEIPAGDVAVLGGDADVLGDCGVVEESTVFLSLELAGGGKKRKKKTYTKPKKIKHVHKSEKLAVLRYYKVGDDSKVVRLRRECPHPSCGKGVFMATHMDRHACGKCGLTYIYDEMDEK